MRKIILTITAATTLFSCTNNKGYDVTPSKPNVSNHDLYSTNTVNTFVSCAKDTVGVITVSAPLFAGSAVQCYDFTPNGVWSVTNNNATIDTNGILRGISIGSDTILYTVNGIQAILPIQIKKLGKI